MHCVFNSMVGHLSHDQTREGSDRGYDLDWMIYWTIRAMTQGVKPQRPTSGVIVPSIFRLVAARRGLAVRIQHRVCDQGHYIDEAGKTLTRVGVAIARVTDYGEFAETITLQPAVYLCLAGHHATFAKAVPQKGGVLMALQFYQPTD